MSKIMFYAMFSALLVVTNVCMYVYVHDAMSYANDVDGFLNARNRRETGISKTVYFCFI